MEYDRLVTEVERVAAETAPSHVSATEIREALSDPGAAPQDAAEAVTVLEQSLITRFQHQMTGVRTAVTRWRLGEGDHADGRREDALTAAADAAAYREEIERVKSDYQLVGEVDERLHRWLGRPYRDRRRAVEDRELDVARYRRRLSPRRGLRYSE